MSPVWYNLFLKLSNFPGGKDLAAILVKVCLRNSQADLGLDAA